MGLGFRGLGVQGQRYYRGLKRYYRGLCIRIIEGSVCEPGLGILGRHGAQGEKLIQRLALLLARDCNVSFEGISGEP